MRVLITGINSRLANGVLLHHLSAGDSVTGVYHRNVSNIPAGLPVWSSEAIVNSAEQYDLVYLIGSYVPRGSYNLPNKKFFESNIRDIYTLCDRFHAAHFVFCSSVAVYGMPLGIIDENSAFNRPTLYGLSKIAGELIVKQCASYSIVRLSSLYGKGDGFYGFVNRIIAQALADGEVKIFGDGSRKQNYLHLDDAIGYLVAAGENRCQETFLAADHRSYSNLEVAKYLQSLQPSIKIIREGVDHSPSFIFNNHWTRTALNYSSRKELFTGIAEMMTL